MKNKNSTENGECVIIGNMLKKNEGKILNGTISKNIIGIYKITNRINGKCYIGSSNNIKARWRNHKLELTNSTHKNKHLLNAWAKYGPSNFLFKIVKQLPNETCKKDIL